MSAETTKRSRSKKVTNSDNVDNTVIQQNDIREINVEVSKYGALDSILSSNKKTIRVLGLLFSIAIFLFLVIFVVSISLKRIYSYSDITTNALGATTISSENSEVSYWLYNTSQLWANSGISVKKGDVITVRSSGKFVTAIHHLYEDSKENKKPKDAWVGSEGEKDNPDPTSSTYLRRQFRMFPNLPTGALVMQVVNNVPYDSQYEDEVTKDPSLKKNFYFIGKERENIYIENSGTLYFSLNDIVLNKRVIREMLQKELDSKDTIMTRLFKDFYDKELKSVIDTIRPGTRKLGKLRTGVTFIKIKDAKNKLGIKPENLQSGLKNFKSAKIIGETIKIGELEYYYQMDYRKAWFDDNLGSFLIIVEKNTSK